MSGLIIEKILGDKEPKQNPRIWYERAHMFLEPKEAKVFCEKLEIYCKVDQDPINWQKKVTHQMVWEKCPLTTNDFFYLADTMEYLSRKGKEAQ